jgi:hypothetical protein
LFWPGEGGEMAGLSDQGELLVRRFDLVEVGLRCRCRRQRVALTLEDEERRVKARSEPARVNRQLFAERDSMRPR